VTASIGVASTTAPLPGADLLARADRAMYQAKQTGRDRIQLS
jgi:PleD family two-component response regulator